MDTKELTRALSELAETLGDGPAITDALNSLAARVMLVLGVDYVGVSLHEADHLRISSAIDERIAVLEQSQEAGQSGPCIDAWRSGATVAASDLRNTPRRWDRYQSVAGDLGIVAVAAIPLRSGDHSIGALGLYSMSARDWSDDDLLAARVLADLATSYVVTAFELTRQHRVAWQLSEALDSRTIIEQAKGFLAAERRIHVGEAFDVIRRYARSRGVTLRTVAAAVVRAGLRP